MLEITAILFWLGRGVSEVLKGFQEIFSLFMDSILSGCVLVVLIVALFHEIDTVLAHHQIHTKRKLCFKLFLALCGAVGFSLLAQAICWAIQSLLELAMPGIGFCVVVVFLIFCYYFGGAITVKEATLVVFWCSMASLAMQNFCMCWIRYICHMCIMSLWTFDFMVVCKLF